jgi:hypothetical protein
VPPPPSHAIVWSKITSNLSYGDDGRMVGEGSNIDGTLSTKNPLGVWALVFLDPLCKRHNFFQNFFPNIFVLKI